MNPRFFLIRDCDCLAKEVREEYERTEEEQIAHYRKLAIMKDGVLLDKAIGEVIRITDAEVNEIDYLVSKFGENWQLVDYEARITFYEGATVSVLKYSSGFNYHKKDMK